MSHSLQARFHRLFHSVEATRERKQFEFSYDLTQEDYRKVTPVNPWHRRILSQLDFCLQMGEHGGVPVSAPVEEALSVFESALAKDGVLTNTACALAEERLLPLAEQAKAYTLLMVGHAHLDAGDHPQVPAHAQEDPGSSAAQPREPSQSAEITTIAGRCLRYRKRLPAVLL